MVHGGCAKEFLSEIYNNKKRGENTGYDNRANESI